MDNFSKDEARRELESLEADIVSLKARMEASEDVTPSDRQELNSLEQRKNDLLSRWNDVKSKSESAWEEVKENVRTGLDDVKQGFDNLRQRYL